VRTTQPTPEISIMQIAKIVIAVATLFGATVAYADGFDITRSMSNGRELRLLEHTAECAGGPGAFVYSNGKQVDQTCNVRVTPAGASVQLTPFDPRIFFPRDTLYPNS
jgi:hypothetical protein